MALDVGDKRIGVAVSDPFNSYAMPLKTYFRTGELLADAKALASLAEQEGVGEVVMGLPLNADGTRGIQAEKTERFCRVFQEQTKIPVYLEDERYTTREARRDLVEMGVSAKRDKRNKAVDSLAATYILEGYLAKRKEKNNMSMKEERKDFEEEEDNIVELIDEEGVKREYEHLMTFEYKSEWYVALTLVEPAEEADEDEGAEIAIYHLVGEEDSEELETVEDEALLDELFEEFCRLYEEDADEE